MYFNFWLLIASARKIDAAIDRPVFNTITSISLLSRTSPNWPSALRWVGCNCATSKGNDAPSGVFRQPSTSWNRIFRIDAIFGATDSRVMPVLLSVHRARHHRRQSKRQLVSPSSSLWRLGWFLPDCSSRLDHQLGCRVAPLSYYSDSYDIHL